jgi:hypothetical protein
LLPVESPELTEVAQMTIARAEMELQATADAWDVLRKAE